MLDLAEVLNDWLVECPLTLDEIQRDEMAMWLAERKETLHHILRSGKLPEAEDGTNGRLLRTRAPRLKPQRPRGGSERTTRGNRACKIAQGEGRLSPAEFAHL